MLVKGATVVQLYSFTNNTNSARLLWLTVWRWLLPSPLQIWHNMKKRLSIASCNHKQFATENIWTLWHVFLFFPRCQITSHDYLINCQPRCPHRLPPWNRKFLLSIFVGNFVCSMQENSYLLLSLRASVQYLFNTRRIILWNLQYWLVSQWQYTKQVSNKNM